MTDLRGSITSNKRSAGSVVIGVVVGECDLASWELLVVFVWMVLGDGQGLMALERCRLADRCLWHEVFRTGVCTLSCPLLEQRSL